MDKEGEKREDGGGGGGGGRERTEKRKQAWGLGVGGYAVMCHFSRTEACVRVSESDREIQREMRVVMFCVVCLPNTYAYLLSSLVCKVFTVSTSYTLMALTSASAGQCCQRVCHRRFHQSSFCYSGF